MNEFDISDLELDIILGDLKQATKSNTAYPIELLWEEVTGTWNDILEIWENETKEAKSRAFTCMATSINKFNIKKYEYGDIAVNDVILDIDLEDKIEITPEMQEVKIKIKGHTYKPYFTQNDVVYIGTTPYYQRVLCKKM